MVSLTPCTQGTCNRRDGDQHGWRWSFRPGPASWKQKHSSPRSSHLSAVSGYYFIILQ